MEFLAAAGASKRGPGRPRALPVTDKPLSDWEAFGRLRAGHALNSFQAVRVMAFCAVWQRVGGTVDAVVASGHCGVRTAYSRLAECRRSGFEPELVEWRLQDAEWWEEFADQEMKHLDVDYARELKEYMRLPGWRRRVQRPPLPHRDHLEVTAE